MDYVNFGLTGMKVSRIALGLGFRGQNDATEAQKVIEHAIELGINLIDCANVYGLMDHRNNIGRSEEILGRVLRKHRDEIVITSKVASSIGQRPNDQGLSRYHIIREIERSLKRLQTDHLDVYLVHAFDNETPLDETVRALDDLVTAGKTRYAGCCNYDAWQVVKALWIAHNLSASSYICVQNPYSLLNRDIESEMFPLAADSGLGIMAYSPLGVGLLSGAYTPNQPPPSGTLWASGRADQFAIAISGKNADIVSTVRQISNEIGKTPAQVALAWVLSHREINVAITGGDTVQHLEDNIGSIGWTLEKNQIFRLDEVSASVANVLD